VLWLSMAAAVSDQHTSDAVETSKGHMARGHPWWANGRRERQIDTGVIHKVGFRSTSTSRRVFLGANASLCLCVFPNVLSSESTLVHYCICASYSKRSQK